SAGLTPLASLEVKPAPALKDSRYLEQNFRDRPPDRNHRIERAGICRPAFASCAMSGRHPVLRALALHARYALNPNCRQYFASGDQMASSATASSYNPTRDDFAAMLDEAFAGGNLLESSVIKGKVVAIEKDMAVIEVALKTEARVA